MVARRRGAASTRRHERTVREHSLVPRAAAAAAIAVLACLAACGGEKSPSALDETHAIEATFGASWCRRIEEPTEIAALVEARRALEGRWQPAWIVLGAPGLELAFLGPGGDEIERLGVGGGQAQTEIDGRHVFRAIDEATAARLVKLAGGPPIGTPDRACRLAPRAPG
jgi:hypothetical protein